MQSDAEGSSRLVNTFSLPAWVLNKYHRGFVRMTSREDSFAFDDLVADGVVKLIELDGRLPLEVSDTEFRSRAIGHLMLYYRHRYRQLVGLYRGKNKEDRKRIVPVRCDLESVPENLLAVEDQDLAWLIAVYDFVETYECPYPTGETSGSPSPPLASSGGSPAPLPLESRSQSEARSPAV